MENRITNDRPEGDVMALVTEGMEVYDRDQKKVGEVESLFMGAQADSVGSEPALTTGSAPMENDSLVEDVARVFTDDMPEVVRSRLRHSGFIRVDGGLFSGDRYALREHIASVTGDRVILNIRGEEMISA